MNCLSKMSRHSMTRKALFSACGLTLALSLSGCWVKPAGVKTDSATTAKDAEKSKIASACVDVADASTGPKGSKKLDSVKDLIDGKNGDYELRSVSLFKSKKVDAENETAGALEISIERKDEEKKITQESVRSKVLCTSSTGKAEELAFDSDVVDAFSRTEGIFSTRRTIRVTLPAVPAAKAPAATANPKDAVDGNNQKEKRSFGLGDPAVNEAIAALTKNGESAAGITMTQNVYRISEKEIEVRVTQVNEQKTGQKTVSSFAARYELIEDGIAPETGAGDDEGGEKPENVPSDTLFSAIRGASPLAPEESRSVTQISVSVSGVATKTITTGSTPATSPVSLSEDQKKELAACAIELEKSPEFKADQSNCADDPGTAYYLGDISKKQIGMTLCGQTQIIQGAACAKKTIEILESLMK